VGGELMVSEFAGYFVSLRGGGAVFCHPERALFVKRRIWAGRAEKTARLARFLIKLHHYPTSATN